MENSFIRLRNGDFRDRPLSIPSKVYGISTRATLSAAYALEKIGHVFMPTKVPQRFTEMTKGALLLLPMLEEIATRTDKTITADDAKNMRRGVRHFHPAAKAAAFIPFVFPLTRLKHAANKRIDTAFQAKAPEAFVQIASMLSKAEPIVKAISQFENPRAAYLHDMRFLAERIAPRQEIGTLEAGELLHDALRGILQRTEETSFPFLSHVLQASKKINAMRNISLPSGGRLSIFISELIYAMESSYWFEEKPHFYTRLRKLDITNLRRLFRGVARKEKKTLQEDLPELLCAIGQMLPEDGATLAKEFTQLQQSFMLK